MDSDTRVVSPSDNLVVADGTIAPGSFPNIPQDNIQFDTASAELSDIVAVFDAKKGEQVVKMLAHEEAQGQGRACLSLVARVKIRI